jgi:hypothetical protein
MVVGRWAGAGIMQVETEVEVEVAALAIRERIPEGAHRPCRDQQSRQKEAPNKRCRGAIASPCRCNCANETGNQKGVDLLPPSAVRPHCCEDGETCGGSACVQQDALCQILLLHAVANLR